MSQKKSPNQSRQVFPVRPETGLDLRSNKTVCWQLRNCVPFFLSALQVPHLLCATPPSSDGGPPSAPMRLRVSSWLQPLALGSGARLAGARNGCRGPRSRTSRSEERRGLHVMTELGRGSALRGTTARPHALQPLPAAQP